MNPVPPRSDYHSRPLPTTPDRNYAVSSSRTPSRRDPPPIPPYSHGGTGGASQEWQPRIVDDPVRRELEEARARTAQMEKTMRWWSDCTANWREKWSKAREERNQAREECRRLRSELDISVTECGSLSQHRDRLMAQAHAMQQELKLLRNSPMPFSGSAKNAPCAESSSAVSDSINRNGSEMCDVSCTEKDSSELPLSGAKQCDSKTVLESAQFCDLQKLLNEANATLESKSREIEELSKSLGELRIELSDVAAQRCDLAKSEHDAKVEVEKLKKWKHDHIERMASDIEDDATSGGDIDKRLADLRRELEKLQAENAQEWAQREKVSSEKLSLERENKKMRSEISRLEEELSKLGRSSASNTVIDQSTKALQEDIAIKTKELTELRHSHSRMKKSLQDRTAELEHAKSRAEQYETEVKKLRQRIEELKRDLAAAEDESDQQANQSRRLQRVNEELQQQIDSLNVELQHLQDRLQKPMITAKLSTGNSSEDLMANDLSDTDGDVAENPDAVAD